MNSMMSTLMLSCARATELIDKQDVFGLHWHEALRLKFHRSVCDVCNNYLLHRDIVDSLLRLRLSSTADLQPSKAAEFLDHMHRFLNQRIQ